MSFYSIDSYLEYCERLEPAHNLQELKDRNTKKKGDRFEHFCCMYMTHCYKIKMRHVWLLQDVPLEIRDRIGLLKQDLGIDIVCEDLDGLLYAIQVKYRCHKPNKKTVIGWKELSTFYALAMRLGTFVESNTTFVPAFKKHIVFTSADRVRHVKRSPFDETIAYRKLCNMSYFDWININGDTTPSLPQVATDQKILSQEQLRKKRLLVFSNAL